MYRISNFIYIFPASATEDYRSRIASGAAAVIYFNFCFVLYFSASDVNFGADFCRIFSRAMRDQTASVSKAGWRITVITYQCFGAHNVVTNQNVNILPLSATTSVLCKARIRISLLRNIHHQKREGGGYDSLLILCLKSKLNNRTMVQYCFVTHTHTLGSRPDWLPLRAHLNLFGTDGHFFVP